MGTLQNILLTIGIFSLVVLGVMNFTGDIASRYSVSYTDLSYMNKTQQLNSKMIAIQETLNKTDVTAVQKVDAFFTGGYQVLMLIPESLNIFSTILFESGSILGLPFWVIPGVLAIITIVLIFGIISAMQKYSV